MFPQFRRVGSGEVDFVFSAVDGEPVGFQGSGFRVPTAVHKPTLSDTSDSISPTDPLQISPCRRGPTGRVN